MATFIPVNVLLPSTYNEIYDLQGSALQVLVTGTLLCNTNIQQLFPQKVNNVQSQRGAAAATANKEIN
jgi:hypothetical protein